MQKRQICREKGMGRKGVRKVKKYPSSRHYYSP
jgi:hypothetical protein